MDDAERRLDGNAAAGVLREVFVYDLSGATRAVRLMRSDWRGRRARTPYMQPLSPARFFDVGAAESALYGVRPQPWAVQVTCRG
jgi:hypothetical protein